MKCPHCGHAQNRVQDTKDYGSYVTRYRLCRGCGSIFATKEACNDAAPGSTEPAATSSTESRLRQSFYRPADPQDIPSTVSDSVGALVLQWWNESRWSKHRAKAAWTRGAFLSSVCRLVAMPEAAQLELAQAGVEFGWQALKPEYLPRASAPPTGEFTPTDPAMLEALN